MGTLRTGGCLERSSGSDWQREEIVFSFLRKHLIVRSVFFSCSTSSLFHSTKKSRCAVALLAQFYPGKPPETSGLLAWCIIVYVVLTAATAAFSMAAEGDAFLVTRQPKSAKPSAASSPAAAAAVAKAAAKAEGLPLPPLRVSSNMARFEPEYELVLKSRAKSGEKASTSASSSTTVAVEARSHLKATSFFRTDGSLESNALKKDVCALLDEIEAKVAAAAKSGGGGASRGGPRSSPRTKRN